MYDNNCINKPWSGQIFFPTFNVKEENLKQSYNGQVVPPSISRHFFLTHYLCFQTIWNYCYF